MGGGDLNLKKSWHPSTLRNIERVWKAEQKHEAEQKKIEQLQKELAEERSRDEIRQYAEDQGVLQKKSERLDWMYQGPAAMVNRDDYLLGRSVDQTFELLQQVESGNLVSEEDNVPGSVARHTGSGSVLTVDLENKIREDPLLHIRKQEEDSKRKLLDNPVRMKQIQLLLRKMNKKESKKVGKKSKKEVSESSSDDERKSSKRRNSRSPQRHRRHRRASKTREERISKVRLEERDRNKRDFRSAYSGHRDRSNERVKIKKERSKSPILRKPDMKKRHSPVRKATVTKTKLNEEERERRLQEMMQNAKWRDEKRTNYVKNYREEEKKEEKMQMAGSSTNFIRPLLAKAANSTVEDRIKSNMYNIQRSRSDLEKNFARR